MLNPSSDSKLDRTPWQAQLLGWWHTSRSQAAKCASKSFKMQNLNHPVPSTPRPLVRRSPNLCLLGRYAVDRRACRQANKPQASSDHIPFTFVGESALNSNQVRMYLRTSFPRCSVPYSLPGIDALARVRTMTIGTAHTVRHYTGTTRHNTPPCTPPT